MPSDEQIAGPQPLLRGPETGDVSTQLSGNALGGFVAASRTQDALELIAANPLAYVLAAVIAYRARWSESFNRHGLEMGEALLGDHEAYGMTQQQYRTAKSQLTKWNFATFKSTNKGTVGSLTDTRLFNVLLGASNKRSNERLTISQQTANNRATSEQQSSNERLTTNEDREEGKEGEQFKHANTGRRGRVGVLVPDKLNTPEFLEAWEDWVNFYDEMMGECSQTDQLESELEDLLKFDVPEAIGRIQAWKEIFIKRLRQND